MTFPGQAHLPRNTQPSRVASGGGHALRSLAICSLERFLNTCHAESFADTQCPSWRILAMPPLSPSKLGPAVPAPGPRPSASHRIFVPALASSHDAGLLGMVLLPCVPMCCLHHCSLLCSQRGGRCITVTCPGKGSTAPSPGWPGAQPTAGALGPNSATRWLCGSPSLCRTQLYCERGSSWHPRPDQEGVPQGGQCLAKCSGESWQELLLASHVRGM